MGSPSLDGAFGDHDARRRLQPACNDLVPDPPTGFNTGMKSLAVRVLGDFGVDGIEPQALGSRKARLALHLLALATGRPCRPGC
jgi:hypothetical protein